MVVRYPRQCHSVFIKRTSRVFSDVNDRDFLIIVDGQHVVTDSQGQLRLLAIFSEVLDLAIKNIFESYAEGSRICNRFDRMNRVQTQALELIGVDDCNQVVVNHVVHAILRASASVYSG